jgi:hypothetical protein
MLAPIVEHVDERIAYFARRAEQASVEAIRPHATMACERGVDGLGDANGESLDPTRESRGRVRFDEQVDVVVLNAELENAKTLTGRGGQGAADGCKYATLSQ